MVAIQSDLLEHLPNKCSDCPYLEGWTCCSVAYKGILDRVVQLDSQEKLNKIIAEVKAMPTRKEFCPLIEV